MIPVQILKSITGEICLDWLRLFTYDKHEQEKPIRKLADKYGKTVYEIRQILKEIK